MRPDEYRSHDALGLAALVRSKEVTAEELLDLALQQVADTDQQIAAVVYTQADRARRAIAAGLPDGAFTGVPFLIKDLGCDAVDFPTSMGSALYRDYRYSVDSELFIRLERAGLVTFARTTSPEFGIGPTSEGAVYGRPTRNPWNLGHVAGGSSAGSAAAVAAGIVPIAHGSDGGGSVRIPASSCGLFGLKPTRARLPDGPSAGEGWAGMAIDGFLTRSVRDTAALVDATHGPDIGAPYHAPPLDGDLLDAIATAPRRLRIAYSTLSFTGDPVHRDCRAAVEHTVSLCAQAGHDMVEADPNVDIHRFMRSWTNIVACGTELTVRSREAELGRAARLDELDGVTRGAVALGRTISGGDYLDAVNTVHEIGRHMARFLADETWIRHAADVDARRTTGSDRAIQARQRGFRRLPDGPARSVGVLTVHSARQRHRPAGDVRSALLELRRTADRHPLHGALRRRGLATAARRPTGGVRPLVHPSPVALTPAPPLHVWSPKAPLRGVRRSPQRKHPASQRLITREARNGSAVTDASADGGGFGEGDAA